MVAREPSHGAEWSKENTLLEERACSSKENKRRSCRQVAVDGPTHAGDGYLNSPAVNNTTVKGGAGGLPLPLSNYNHEVALALIGPGGSPLVLPIRAKATGYRDGYPIKGGETNLKTGFTLSSTKNMPKRARTRSNARRPSNSYLRYIPAAISTAEQIGQAYNAYRSYTGTTTQTERSTQAMAKSGASYKTSGFISTPFVAKKRTYSKFDRYGVVQTAEVGGVLDSGATGNTVIIGHSTCPGVSLHASMWRAIIKSLFIKAGLDVTNFDAAIPGVSTNDAIRVVYRANKEVGTTNNDYTTMTSAEAASVYFADQFSGIADANDDTELLDIQLNPGAAGTTFLPSTRLSLKGAKLALFCKSHLKVQNRSTNTVGGDEEAIDNLPLHGKAYYGPGNGTDSMTTDTDITPSVGIRCENNYGAVAKAPTENWYKEVLQPANLENCKKFGKIVIEPGYIKTSVLKMYKIIELDQFYKKVTIRTSGTNLSDVQTLGNFRAMMLEKIMDTATGSAANSIKIGYEVNMMHGAYLILKRNTTTMALTAVNNYATEL